MNELQATQLDWRHFLKPDSVLVRTALDLVAAHVADGAEGESASCRLCGLRFPCPTAHHARQVVDAAGVNRAADRTVERVPEAAPDPVLDTASDIVPDPVPDIVPDTVPDIVPDVVRDTVSQGASGVESARVPEPDSMIDDEMPVPDPVGAA